MMEPGKEIHTCRGERFAVANRTRATQGSPPIDHAAPAPTGVFPRRMPNLRLRVFSLVSFFCYNADIGAVQPEARKGNFYDEKRIYEPVTGRGEYRGAGFKQ